LLIRQAEVAGKPSVLHSAHSYLMLCNLLQCTSEMATLYITFQPQTNPFILSDQPFFVLISLESLFVNRT